MIKQLVCRLFSVQCQLKSLRLDIGNDFINGSVHTCLASNSYFSSNFIQYKLESCCMTLHRLDIRLICTDVLENLIEHLSNLEQISVEFVFSLGFNLSWKWNVETLKQSNENWFNKIPKLRCFTLKTFINNDLEFVYLKWLLNNLNYGEKLEIQLKNENKIGRTSQNIWKCLIDANFIRQYCLPDRIINLINFNFYICSECQLSLNDIEKITNSFKIHSFFIDYKWTNVECLFDPIMSCQHIFSYFPTKLNLSNNLMLDISLYDKLQLYYFPF
ncbi:unnamed protein product [Rotaria sordida]|uniref:Uncharacterized protein n=2 Tax=Rotaria sordida TaxID=392033 RepID=A0A819ZVH6_9BILA|nr:unnamed protein product [Rotaria sordida]CAF4176430.1 unnamed protein product [Rotaria sordida]